MIQVGEPRGNAAWPQCDTASLQAERSTLWSMGEAVGGLPAGRRGVRISRTEGLAHGMDTWALKEKAEISGSTVVISKETKF